MKLHNIYIGLAALATVAGAVSCSDDFDRPPVIVPEATIKANTSILELKEKYYADAANMPEIGLTASGEHIIIGGRVVTSDECGNIYQRIIIDDGTAAIPIRVYATKLYETYHLGQEVFIDVTGLLFGSYNGWYMIGVDYNGGIGGMESEVMSARAQVNGLPDISKLPVYEISISDVDGFKANDTEMLTWQSRSVTFTDVKFVGAGSLQYGDPASSNSYITRKLTDASGKTIDISTSNKCTFAGTTMPTGNGNVTATLSIYRDAWQIVISNPETDCIGFDAMSGDDPDTPDTPAEGAAQLTADFETGALPAGWTETTTSGNRNWQVKSFNSNYYAQCSAYKGTAGTDGFKSWLITSAIDFDKMTEKTMSFETEIQYSGVSDLQLYVMTSADPKTAEMTELTFTKPEPNANESSTGYLFSGEIDLSQFTGVKYVAWLYTAVDPDASRTYRVDNVKIGYKADQKPDLPDTPVTGTAQFRATGQVVSGHQYVLGVDNLIGSVIGQNLSYGRLALVAPVAIEGEGTLSATVTTSVENALVFTAADGRPEGTYTITDTYGRFLSMDGKNFSSFQLYTAPTEGSYWTVVCSNSNTVKITNVLCPAYSAVKSGTFTNIAPSDTEKYPTYTVPVLYEKID